MSRCPTPMAAKGRLLGAEHEQMAAALDALEVPGRMNRYEGNVIFAVFLSFAEIFTVLYPI